MNVVSQINHKRSLLLTKERTSLVDKLIRPPKQFIRVFCSVNCFVKFLEMINFNIAKDIYYFRTFVLQKYSLMTFL
jgi:hypothetical protein